MSVIVFDRDEAQAAFLDTLPFDPPQGAQFTMRIQPGHDLGPTYQAGELVTFHVDDTPTLGATWLFDNGDDVTIALVLGWDDVHWFVQDAEGAWKVPRAAWLPRASHSSFALKHSTHGSLNATCGTVFGGQSCGLSH